MFSSSSLTHLSIEEEGKKIELKKEKAPQENASNLVFSSQLPGPTYAGVPLEISEKGGSPEEVSPKEEPVTIRSQMVGTFYSAPSPEASPFVTIGDVIKPGQVICVIEAMKLFNEIESEVTGTIKKVLVENGQSIEYDQPLFELHST